MLRSLFSGVTGLKSHQTKMDVIGNNIANVNTYGFKSSRTTFRDVYYQTISSSTSASGTRSGSNASQVGYGTSVASVDVLNTRTGYAATGNSMDLYIDGEGYFVVQDGAGNEHLTQVGTFGFDGDGNLTDGNGNFVCGYSVVSTKSTANVGTTKIDFGNIGTEKNGGGYLEGYQIVVKPDSSSADASAVEIDLKKKTITVSLGENKMNKGGLMTALTTQWPTTPTDGDKDSDGKYIMGKDDDGNNVLYENWIAATSFNPANIVVGGIKSGDTSATTGYTDVITATTGKIAEEANFEGNGTGAENVKKIINTEGEMKNISVGTDGTITGEATDGTIKIIGKIAIANVPNPDALQHEGNSYYKAVNNTGVITYTSPGESNTGVLRSGGLEMSNVDLANEFSDMIMTQRGFQANSKMITVSDEMLETLVNLKR
ncbi:flagellar hook-basal body complex protein [Faecalispora jeddahensis]|uniref:flagellar hook-basal body complex protein n=1 Tax=Faecalispora jeddahensis TaxID=1414721 RepID=UPI00189C0F02|nr:flagellar hook-basal body complex protein [Faecalispora jeddahensis]